METTVKQHNSLTYQGRKGKVFKGLSQTRPEAAMSLKTLLEKHQRGLVDLTGRSPLYTEEEDMDLKQGMDVRKFDMTEISEMMEDNQERINKLQKDLQDQNKAQDAARRNKQLQDLKDQIRKEIADEEAAKH